MRCISPCLVGFLLSAHSVWAVQEQNKDVVQPAPQELQSVIHSVHELINDYYVDDVEYQALLQGALKGMLEALDPHSTYLRPHTLSLLRDNNRGHYYGYGLEISVADGQIHVVAPMANSSAESAGVLPGDVLLQIDQLIPDPDDLDPMIAYIKQASLDDRTLDVTLERDGQPQLMQLTPSNIEVISTEAQRFPRDIGYIKINSFNQRTLSELRVTAHEFSQHSAPLQGLLLDLRNNPGGLLDVAVQVADMFLQDGMIVSTHGRFFDANNHYQATPFAAFADLPVVVIINQGSASAAEILAGALQDQQRATLLGEPTFGKGTVQSLIPLLAGGGAIKLTTARYATPNGTFIDQNGIMPDIVVDAYINKDELEFKALPVNFEDDLQLLAAYELLVEDLAKLANP